MVPFRQTSPYLTPTISQVLESDTLNQFVYYKHFHL